MKTQKEQKQELRAELLTFIDGSFYMANEAEGLIEMTHHLNFLSNDFTYFQALLKELKDIMKDESKNKLLEYLLTKLESECFEPYYIKKIIEMITEVNHLLTHLAVYYKGKELIDR